MKGKVRFAVAALLLAAFVAVFAGEALAAKNPSWVGISSRTWRVVRNSAQNDITKSNYWIVQVSVETTNNSKDRDITAFYDCQLRVSAKLASGPRMQVGSGARAFTRRFVDFIKQPEGTTVRDTADFPDPRNVTIWPGQKFTRNMDLGLHRFVTLSSINSWRDVNEFLDKVGGNRNSILTDVTIGYDFHVRSKKSD